MKAVRRPSAPRDHIRGPLDAEISLIEYSDFECAYCKTFHENAAELLKVFNGGINWVYRTDGKHEDRIVSAVLDSTGRP